MTKFEQLQNADAKTLLKLLYGAEKKMDDEYTEENEKWFNAIEEEIIRRMK